jgi:hypothetical protein
MPGSPLLSLLRFVASHLVLLTLAGFIAVGGWLSGYWGTPPAPMPADRSQGRVPHPATDGATGPGTAAVPVVPPDQRGISTPTGPVQPGGQGAPPLPGPAPTTSNRQPPLIGGTLPNYGSAGEGFFRPPAAGGTPSGSPNREDLVQTARRAFWNGDFEAAETAYMNAIMRYPDDADLFGELGNLYDAMGQRKRSLDAFYEAALRLRAEGKLNKLSEVMDLLESHDYPFNNR